jgi:hypothetical protein
MKTTIRIISGLLNYSVAIMLLAMPFINSGEQGIMAHIVTSFTGALIMVITLLTKFEPGLFKMISLREYLFFGMAVGVFMLVSPFVFGFYPYGFLFHLIAGLLISTFSFFVHRSIFMHRHKNVVNA